MTITPEERTIALLAAAVTMAVATFYGIRKHKGPECIWYVASMLFGGALGVIVAWETGVSVGLAFTIGLSGHQLVRPLRQLLDRWSKRAPADERKSDDDVQGP